MPCTAAGRGQTGGSRAHPHTSSVPSEAKRSSVCHWGRYKLSFWRLEKINRWSREGKGRSPEEVLLGQSPPQTHHLPDTATVGGGDTGTGHDSPVLFLPLTVQIRASPFLHCPLQGLPPHICHVWATGGGAEFLRVTPRKDLIPNYLSFRLTHSPNTHTGSPKSCTFRKVPISPGTQGPPSRNEPEVQEERNQSRSW